MTKHLSLSETKESGGEVGFFTAKTRELLGNRRRSGHLVNCLQLEGKGDGYCQMPPTNTSIFISSQESNNLHDQLDWQLWLQLSKFTLGIENGNPLQYSCLENFINREDWQATDHGLAKSQTWLSRQVPAISNIPCPPSPTLFFL